MKTMMNCCEPLDCCSSCKKPKDECRCPDQILAIENLSDNLAYLTFNDGGRSVNYDFGPMILATQTDTSISADRINRVLKYMSERHIDTISAKELGSILHIADIGDVDITKVGDNSLFVYQKNSDCGEGCEGINNSWTAWNALEHLADSVQHVMGFDGNGKPFALNAPLHTNQYYQLGWNAENKVSFSQPQEVATPPKDSDNYVYRVYMDPDTKQLVYTREAAQ